MKIFGLFKKVYKKIDERTGRDDESVCSECEGEGYIINDNHYFVDNYYDYDYERRYSICRRCSGTGRYHSNII